jgi:ATP-dependent RNA helicase DeaD
MNASEPQDLPSFDVLPLSAELRQAIDELGYDHPTPVQRAVYEPALRGQDLVVQARTGTGKTASFGMPLIDGLVRKNQSSVQALVLCPTRELALQVHRELDRLGRYRQMRTVAVYGGAPMARQIQEIAAGAQIVVGTPGRVLDHLQRESLNPSNIRVYILDESDEMLSMGFLPQINEIQSYLPKPHQTLLFSATLPADIQRLAETRLNSPVFLTLSGDHIGALDIQHLTYFSRRDKLEDLLRVIEVEDPEGAIIFCNTKDETKRVAAALEKRAYSVEWLNADLAQSDREKVMEATRLGQLRFLVCTDVASRGIDISHLTHVINYDFPESPEAYVHRTGRTGRAGRTGTAVSLVTPADIGYLYILRLTYKIAPIERHLPSMSELRTREQMDLVDMFVEAFTNRVAHDDDVMLARRMLTHESAELVLAGLLRDHLGTRPDAAVMAADNRRSRMPSQSEPVEADTSMPLPREQEAVAPASVHRVPLQMAPQSADSPRVELASSDKSPPRRRRRRRVDLDPAENGAKSASFDSTDEFEIKYSVGDQQFAPVHHLEGSGDSINSARRVDSADRPKTDSSSVVPEDESVEIFVSLGRRDGISSEDVLEVLQTCAIPKLAVTHISVRHHHSFVGVKRPNFGSALAALDGASIAGHLARAEPAKSSRP